MHDFVPQKLAFPHAKKLEGMPEIQLQGHELARINNIAYRDICRNDRKYDESLWKYYKDMIFTDITRKEVTEQY